MHFNKIYFYPFGDWMRRLSISSWRRNSLQIPFLKSQFWHHPISALSSRSQQKRKKRKKERSSESFTRLLCTIFFPFIYFQVPSWCEIQTSTKFQPLRYEILSCVCVQAWEREIGIESQKENLTKREREMVERAQVLKSKCKRERDRISFI